MNLKLLKYAMIPVSLFALFGLSRFGNFKLIRQSLKHRNNAMDGLVGKWKLETSHNLDAVLRLLGVDSIHRSIAATLTTYMDITKVNEEEYEIESITGPVEKNRRMISGVEFEEDAPIGGRMFGYWKVMQNNRMEGLIYFKRVRKKMMLERFLDGWQLIETMKVGNQSCRRIFRRRNTLYEVSSTAS